MRIFHLALLITTGTGLVIQAPAPSFRSVVYIGSRVRRASTPFATAQGWDEVPPKSVVTGAAATGGIVGVYFFHELTSGLISAITLAYWATLPERVPEHPLGRFASSTGRTAAGVFNKVVELNERFSVLPKVKSLLDSTGAALQRLDTRYAFTTSLDKGLKLSESASRISSKISPAIEKSVENWSDFKATLSSPDRGEVDLPYWDE